jgi:serine/threonine protein phosphatase PrpC
VTSALLLGRDHQQLGALACVAEGPAAITLSRGGARKTYDHVEPNEDAVLFAYAEHLGQVEPARVEPARPGGLLVAVADGHHGSSGSQAALEHIEAEVAPRWTAAAPGIEGEPAWTAAVLEVLVECNDAVLARAGALGIPSAPTTLSLALVRPSEDLFVYACVGDSHLFRVDAHGARDLGWTSNGNARTYFLGGRAQAAEEIAARSTFGSAPCTGIRAVALATDGLSEIGIGVADPVGAVLAAIEAADGVSPSLRPLEACKHLSRTALRAQREQQAGDNVGCAVLWLDG